MVKLSVLVTFCNQRQYIKRALDSILAQKTNFDFEVLIGLDGVYDGSEEIIREYTDKHDFIRLYKMSFAGMDTIGIEKASLNRKSLLEKAEGEFFSVLDGDDFYGDDPGSFRSRWMFCPSILSASAAGAGMFFIPTNG